MTCVMLSQNHIPFVTSLKCTDTVDTHCVIQLMIEALIDIVYAYCEHYDFIYDHFRINIYIISCILYIIIMYMYM